MSTGEKVFMVILFVLTAPVWLAAAAFIVVTVMTAIILPWCALVAFVGDCVAEFKKNTPPQGAEHVE